MAHILVLELPGGNDDDIIDALLKQGNEFSFLTASKSHYQTNTQVWDKLSQAFKIIETNDFNMSSVKNEINLLNNQYKIDAVICLVDIRLIEAAEIAEMLGLRFLNVKSARLLRDKYQVRKKLDECGITQPLFQLATSATELGSAIDRIGLPVLIKPSDGYGSQNIISLRTQEDLDPILFTSESMLPSNVNYGLGVKANDRLLVERCMSGQIIGCDVLSSSGKHLMLGIHEKLFFPHPSFAIKGGCFVPNKGQCTEIESYVNALLNAVNFNDGASHIEIMLTDEGPMLIEINARLVGAKIPRLVGIALGRSIHSDVINLHLGHPLQEMRPSFGQFAVTRWVVSEKAGQLKKVTTPKSINEHIQDIAIFKQPGDFIKPPIENADRLGYVMVADMNRRNAEQIAESFISEVLVELE